MAAEETTKRFGANKNNFPASVSSREKPINAHSGVLKNLQ